MKRVILYGVLPALLLAALYVFVVINWNYSSGERAGWVQKLSKKGWICKTWEGELSMVSMPGATPEKFYFTIWDDAVAEEVNKAMGRRVSLHYVEKVGLPGSCFGETRHYVSKVTVVPEIPIAPGVMVPMPPAGTPAPLPSQLPPGQPMPQPETAPAVPPTESQKK